MKTLTLTLKKQWFDMIKSGQKKEEYREIKPHYIRQFIKFEPLKNDLIRDYNFHIGFDEGEINGIEDELLNLKYDVLDFLSHTRAEQKPTNGSRSRTRKSASARAVPNGARNLGSNIS